MLVYKITNQINGKIYIGQTTQSLNKRWSQHICDSKYRKKMLISRAISKYGAKNFKIEEIGGANNQSELNYQEWLLIRKNECLYPNGYNMSTKCGATGKTSDVTKEKLSKIAKRRIGNKNPYSKKVINIKTGKVWGSAIEASKKLNINYSTLRDYLNGKIHNKTNLRWKNNTSIYKKEQKIKRKVIDTKTREIFCSISEAAKVNNINRVTLNYKLLNPEKNNTVFKYLEE